MKNRLSKNIKFLVVIFAFSFNVSGQTAKTAERIWLIDYYFKSEKKFHQKLVQIDRLILNGNYSAAKDLIRIQKKNSLTDLQTAAVLCYEGNIAYNESDYQKTIDLCDESIGLLSTKHLKNRYLVKSLNLKAKGLGAFNEYDLAERLIDSSIVITKEIKDYHGLAACYYYRGSFFSDKGNFSKCAEYMEKSIEIRKKIKDELGLAASYSFLGMCYSYMDNYLKGIELIHKSIVIRERMKDKRGLANSYLTLYKVYSEIGEIDKAMKTEFKSLSICLELNDQQCVSGRYTNLGEIFQKKGKYDESLIYHFKALELSRKLNIKNRIGQVYENIARVYLKTGQLQLSKLYIDSSSVLRMLIGDEIGLASIELIRAEVHLKNGETDKSLYASEQALIFGEKLKLPHIIKDAHSLLHKVFKAKHNSNKALFHFERFVNLRDSLYSMDQSREFLRKELEFNFAKKQEIDRLKQAKKSEKAKLENSKQHTIIVYSSSALGIVSLLLGFSFWQFRLKNKSKKDLEIANTNLSSKNSELIEQSKIIEAQSHTIQQKNQEITDSIRYAHKIQTAVLSTSDEFKRHFSDALVFFKPKDIISGDFYWVTEQNNYTIYVTADCTGHGVPGGFMSMLGVSMLNELITENQLHEPAEILNRLREKIILSLKQKGVAGEQQDGMDMTLCVYNKETRIMSYAAANHVLYLTRKEDGLTKLIEFKGDKYPVGIFGDELYSFNPYEIKIEPGDLIYTFTDGFADQFGGTRGKKYKYKQLKELLVKMHDLPLKIQEQKLNESFLQWKGDLEQVDDVCLIGVRF